MRSSATSAALRRPAAPNPATLVRAWPPRGAAKLGGGLGILGACVLLGGIVSQTDGIVGFVGSHLQIVYALAAVGSLAIISRGPVACLAAVAATAAAGGLVPLVSSGRVQFVLVDVFYVGLVYWWAVGALSWMQRQPAPPRPPRVAMGQRAALVMAAVGTASLLYVWAVDPGRISTSAVSWIRIVQTFSIAYLAASVLRTRRDVLVTLGGLVLGTLITTTAALVEVFKDPSAIFATRYEGFVGPNALGLLGGVMVVLGVFGAFGPRWRGRIALILLGGVALLLGKSVGGMVGTGIAIGLGLALRYPSPPLHRATAIVCGVGVSVVIAFGLVQWLRPSATPGSPDFRNSTTSQRTILAAAGLEIWSHHPLIGVGWRRSDSAEVISTRQINIALRTRFQDGRTDFFPDNHETSVHNSYVQVLAEFGVVGFAALIALLIAIGRGLRGVLASIPRGDPLWPLAWVLTLVVVLDLVYFNDTPLYGGQIETVALALVIGCAVAVGRMQARRNAAGP